MAQTSLIRVENVSVEIGGKQILKDLTFSINHGECWAVLGRNGAGKTTLLRVIAKLQKTTRGAIYINGKDIRSLAAKELARKIAYVPQTIGRFIPYRVKEYVLMGRFPYQNFYAVPTKEDYAIVEEAMKLLDIYEVASRPMNTLSGGEFQRALLAGAVAQKTDILLLDEPNTHLDPLHQKLIENALQRIHREMNIAIITITHDINLALNNYSHVLALIDGRRYFEGRLELFRQNLEENLHNIYGIAFQTARIKESHRTVVVAGE